MVFKASTDLSELLAKLIEQRWEVLAACDRVGQTQRSGIKIKQTITPCEHILNTLPDRERLAKLAERLWRILAALESLSDLGVRLTRRRERLGCIEQRLLHELDRVWQLPVPTLGWDI